MLYRVLKIVIGIAIRLYYKKIKIKNPGPINTKGPKIIIANHPNTLMDAWMIGHICRQPIYYMSKAVFFNNPVKRAFLRSLGMIPINRVMDGKTSGVSNEDSFEMCYQILEQGKTLVIFPEGNSFADRFLRRLKSGTARIALQTELRNDGKLGLEIIPVGLIYLEPEKFRSEVLTNIGEPIDPVPYLEEFKQDRLKAARLLTEEFRKQLSDLLVEAETKENETLGDQVTMILSSSYAREKGKKVEQNVSLLRNVNRGLNEIQFTEPDKYILIQSLVSKIEWQINRLQIKTDFLDRKYRSALFLRQILQSILAMIIGLPIFLFGLIHNIIPFKLTDFIVTRVFEDKEWYAAMNVLGGLILYPLTYTGFMYLGDYLVDMSVLMKWIYFASMPITGLFAYYFYHYYRHVSLKWRFTQLMMNREQKEILKDLRKARLELRELVLGKA